MRFNTDYPDEQAELLIPRVTAELGERLAGEVSYSSTVGWRLDLGEGNKLGEQFFPTRRETFAANIAHTIHLRIPVGALRRATGEAPYRDAAEPPRVLVLDVAVTPDHTAGLVAGLRLVAPLRRPPRGPIRLAASGRMFEGREDDVAALNRDPALARMSLAALNNQWKWRGVTLKGPASLTIDAEGGAGLLTLRTMPRNRWPFGQPEMGLRSGLGVWDALDLYIGA